MSARDRRNKAMLTTNQIERVQQAIKETEHLINKESKYSAHLQNKELIDGYLEHIKTLEKMINE
jgi:hypothetical protein